MDAQGNESTHHKYVTPARVQAWFLGRSRDGWKAKYKLLKAHAKRLRNHVSDVTRSREMWRQRVAELESEIAALRKQAAGKKSGPRAGVSV